MEQISRNICTLNNQLIFKLSQIGFALNSELCYTNRVNTGIYDQVEYVAQLKHGDKIFISSSETNVSLHEMVKILESREIKIIFYIMQEPLASLEMIQMLQPVAIRIFVQNNIYDLPNVHIMPIGIRDCGTITHVHKGFSHATLLEEGTNALTYKRSVNCLLCFSVGTYIDYRRECYELFKNKPFIYNLNDDNDANSSSNFENPFFCGAIKLNVVYRKTRESRYALCPRGYGVDTHRFYECIYLGCVPIVTRTNTVFDRLYAAFPCLIVDDWSDVTEDLLESSYPECWRRMCDFHVKYPRFLTDLESIEGLLRRL
jgi:hypothetical protein